MNRRALAWVRLAWIAATIALMVLWREEALVLFVPLVLLGPLVREFAAAPDHDERARLEDYRASHVALMAFYATLFLVFAKLRYVDGTGIPGEWVLVFAVPLLVRSGLSLGRGWGARRLGLVVSATAGLAWLAFSLISHGLSWVSLSEAWIGGGMLVIAAVGLRRPVLAGSLFLVFSALLFAVVASPLISRSHWAFGLAMTALVVVPPLMAGFAMIVAGRQAGRAAGDEFSDLREDGPRSASRGEATRRRRWPRTATGTGLLTGAAAFLTCVAALAAFASVPPRAPDSGNRQWSERLPAPRQIDGVPCTGRASYRAGGRLMGCTLADEHAFPSGLRLPAGTRVHFDQEGRPETAFLPSVIAFDGHRCIGDGTHNPMTNFHPNGRLRFCNLADPETIDGIPCQKSTFWIWITQGGAGTYFHDNGRLQECLLAADVTVAGTVHKRRQHIVLDRDGVPLAAQSRR